MRIILLTSFLLLALVHEHAAGMRPKGSRPKPRSVRNVLWFHPNRARVVNGVAVGPCNFQSFRWDSSLTVNGLNLELPGVAIFPLPVRKSWITVNGLDLSPFHYGGDLNGFSLAFSSSGYATRGGSIAGFNYVEGSFKGFQAGLFASNSTMRGVQLGSFATTRDGRGVIIGAFMTMTDTVRGLSLGLVTDSKKHRGMQLGVINHTKDLQGLQFGLINVAGNCRRKIMPLLQVRGRTR